MPVPASLADSPMLRGGPFAADGAELRGDHMADGLGSLDAVAGDETFGDEPGELGAVRSD
jgi:hypothetical protein